MTLNSQNIELKSVLGNENETFTALSTTALIAKNAVPVSHKRIADNYIIIKRIYKFQAVQSRITSKDKALLEKYSFDKLENTNIQRINEELEVLKKLANSESAEIREEADNLMQIRTKELKYIIASRYKNIDNELNNGYIALERYFEEITKHFA